MDLYIVFQEGITNEIKTLCSKYWAHNHQRFLYRADVLEKEYGGKGQRILPIIQKSSYVTISEYEQCFNCNALVKYSTRGELDSLFFTKRHFCKKCRTSKYFDFVTLKNAETEIKPLVQEPEIYSQKRHISIDQSDIKPFSKGQSSFVEWPDKPSSDIVFKKMEEAYFREVYVFMQPIDRNFLYYYILEKDYDKASKCTGLANELGRLIAQKLENHYLICSTTGFVLPAIRTLFKNQGEDKRVKNVFGNGLKTKELYLLLKRLHIFVFPNYPISRLIQEPSIGDHFTEFWGLHQYLTCSVDFVVTDQEFQPIFAIEYFSTRFYDPTELKKINQKKEILSNVGFPLYFVNGTDLINMRKSVDNEIPFKIPLDLLNVNRIDLHTKQAPL